MDIAKEAGVSQSTASMILNKKRNTAFSEETIQRVMETAAKLGYKAKPRNKNREFSAQSNFIAAVVPNISNPYYSMLIQSIKVAAAHQGYGLFICSIEDEMETITKYMNMLITMPIQGIIYAFMPYNLEPVKESVGDLPVVIVVIRSVITLFQSSPHPSCFGAIYFFCTSRIRLAVSCNVGSASSARSNAAP
jgi:LacI family transcriptional regulator